MERVRVALVGAGWMGQTLLQRLTERPDVEVVALCEPNAERAGEAIKRLRLPPAIHVSDFDAVIANSRADAVFLVSPNSYHGQQSIAAMQAGKHVFCEKPAATRFDEFCRQIELEKANPKLITFVDYLMNFDSMEGRLRQMAADGVFGTITQVQVNYRHPVNIAGDKVWKLRKDIMGDAIGMGIVHSLSVMINVMSPQARPVSVFATSLAAKVRGFEAEPVWNILLGFDNGGTGFCFGNIDNGNGYDAYHNLYGTQGGFVFDSQLDRPQKVRYWSADRTAGKWVYPLDGERCQREGAEPWPANTSTPDSGDVMQHQTGACVGHFIECVKSGKPSFLSFANSSLVGEVGWAAQMSAGLGKPVALPLDWRQASAFFAGRNS